MEVDLPAQTEDAAPVSQTEPEASEPVANIAGEKDTDTTLEDIIQSAIIEEPQPMEADEEKPVEQTEQTPTEITSTETTEEEKKSATFNLGVPGLKFSSNNVKTAKDGTKMVQIHQSQITPDQLQALQNNPNIKVVFRHVPSGKSYTKAPRHLLPPGYSAPIKKRKANFTEEELEGPDVYSFDEGEDFEGPTKRSRMADIRARYSYGGKKKGRSRLVPDSSTFASSFLNINKQPGGLPAKVILTDLLSRINHPNAKLEVKLHTSQVNAEVLANMELNPAYRVVLTSKQELPPLVIENVGAAEQAKLEKDAADIEKQEKEKEKQEAEKEEQMKEEEKMEEDEQQKQQDEDEEKRAREEEQKRIEEEKELEKQKEAERQKRLAEEEEQLKKSVQQTQKSRSGRIRKPSRFSMDIARLTKRKSTGTSGGDSSDGESEQEPSTLKKFAAKSEETASPARGRGRPKKITSPPPPTKEPDKEEKKEEEEGEKKEESEEQKEETTEKKEEDATESEKEVTSTENMVEMKDDEPIQEKKDEDSKEDDKKEEASTEESKKEASTEESKKEVASTEENKKDEPAQTEPDTSTDAVKASTETTESKPDDEAMKVDETESAKPEQEEEPEVIDNRYRLRKLLEQCSTEEIRSVLLPEAFDSINLGDFLLYKAGQMHNTSGKISFPQLYKVFETLHKDATKEATRYNTLVRRANKVGGDKRMEKIVLMPVYNVEAASSLQISHSCIDAHICGIQRTITTEMIAANSFFIKNKMESPLVRLKLPEGTAPKQQKPKPKRPLYSNQYQQQYTTSQQQEPDSTTPDKPKPQKRQTYGQKISSMRFTTYQGKNQVRRPAYIEELKSTGHITLSGQSHQIGSKAQDSLQSIPVDSTSLLKADVQSSQMVASATSALAQLQATVEQQRQQQQQAVVSTTQNSVETVAVNPATGQVVGTADTTLVTSDAAGQAEQFFVSEDGAPVAAATGEGEVRKHLVPIGDGQYVELPEGYSLIQTDEGYIIGQPGSTFTQGEDGNVYITNSDGTTTEITQQDITGAGEAVAVSQVTEG